VTTPDPADLLHAATCLQERAVLVSNDPHFDRIRDERVIEVWSIAKAIRSLEGPRSPAVIAPGLPGPPA